MSLGFSCAVSWVRGSTRQPSKLRECRLEWQGLLFSTSLPSPSQSPRLVKALQALFKTLGPGFGFNVEPLPKGDKRRAIYACKLSSYIANTMASALLRFATKGRMAHAVDRCLAAICGLADPDLLKSDPKEGKINVVGMLSKNNLTTAGVKVDEAGGLLPFGLIIFSPFPQAPPHPS